MPSPLAVAIVDRHASPSLAHLIAKGEPFDKLPEPALSLAVARPEAIGPLLAAHADVIAKNAFGKTPLMTVAQFNQIDSVRQFLKAGADVNAVTNAPKDIAENSPKIEGDPAGGCGEYAIAHGSRTALMYAAANGSLEVIKALLAAGADKSKRDSQGSTSLDYSWAKVRCRPIRDLTGRNWPPPSSFCPIDQHCRLANWQRHCLGKRRSILMAPMPPTRLVRHI